VARVRIHLHKAGVRVSEGEHIVINGHRGIGSRVVTGPLVNLLILNGDRRSRTAEGEGVEHDGATALIGGMLEIGDVKVAGSVESHGRIGRLEEWLSVLRCAERVDDVAGELKGGPRSAAIDGGSAANEDFLRAAGTGYGAGVDRYHFERVGRVVGNLR